MTARSQQELQEDIAVVLLAHDNALVSRKISSYLNETNDHYISLNNGLVAHKSVYDYLEKEKKNSNARFKTDGDEMKRVKNKMGKMITVKEPIWRDTWIVQRPAPAPVQPRSSPAVFPPVAPVPGPSNRFLSLQNSRGELNYQEINAATSESEIEVVEESEEEQEGKRKGEEEESEEFRKNFDGSLESHTTIRGNLENKENYDKYAAKSGNQITSKQVVKKSNLELSLKELNLEGKEIEWSTLYQFEGLPAGTGSYKVVHRGALLGYGDSVAIAYTQGEFSEVDKKELNLLNFLQHPNLVGFYGYSIPPKSTGYTLCYITEFCPNGDLFTFIRKETTTLARLQVFILFRGIAYGLQYLHDSKPRIVHRDMKTQNVLVDGNGIAKIVDFGLSKIKVTEQSVMETACGTLNHQAPELLTANPQYTEKVDIYATGLLYWEVMQVNRAKIEVPFQKIGNNPFEMKEHVVQLKKRPNTDGMIQEWGSEVVELVESMWSHDPFDRPSISEVVSQLESMIANEERKISKTLSPPRRHDQY